MNTTGARRMHAETSETTTAGFTTEGAEVRREFIIESAFEFLRVLGS